MDALILVVVTFVGYLVAYHTYGRFLARKIFRLDDSVEAPSVRLLDGVDYVPTRRGIIFGHHYTSIAGTGPIVGPAIGIIWGWVPAIIWVFVGSIVLGAVHDFGALVVSMRNDGKSLSEVADRYIGRRARTIFFLVVFLELLIVIAIFGVVISAIFDKFPRSVFPIWIQIPIAVVLGAAVYRWKANVALATAAAVITMYGTVVVSHVVDGLALTMPALVVGGSEVLPATGVWVVVLLIYAYVASTLPVTVLLQPRDYINAWQLFIAMGALVLGVAPPLWPFLGVTIACGAISGFHCLVSSGTTAKQVRCETDAQFVGYGSMLMEGALAVLVLVSVSAGIGMAYQAKSGEVLKGVAAWNAHYASWGAAGGLDSNVEAVVRGAANMLGSIGIRKGVGVIIMGVFIASFAGTTLDTATRIQRYVISELAISFRLGALANRWVATAIAVVGAGALAFGTGASGKGALTLWPMFGAVNQLLAALALLLVTIYLRRRGTWGYLLTLGPCLFMLVLTVWAMVSKEIEFATKPVSETFPAYQKYILIVLNAGTLLLSLALAVEAFIHIARPRKCELKA
ncbi:MAG: carbon starvation protein CstA [Planctomycetes bacterium DG_20]|nr:MAG: carbon starvation protein CstA [Planctomycetes bacterium DG_20]